MILIVGASGRLGSVLASKLLADNKPVRGLSRNPDKLTNIKNLGAEIIQGDLRNPNSLQAACDGVTTVIASAHSLLGRGKERSALIDYEGHLNLINAAQNANVQHFIYISIIIAKPDVPVPFARYKYEVEEYLKSSGLSYTIIRPCAFIEDHAQEMIGKSIMEKGKVTILGKGESPQNFVAVDDVAKFVLLSLKNKNTHGKIIEVGGPDNLSHIQVVKIYEKTLKKKAKVSHVPRIVLNVMSRLLFPFHQGLSQVMALSLYLDKYGTYFDMTETLKEYPMDLIKLENWVNTRVAKSK
jgi:uncharacterized protein YbjT (DUF2867 family)